MEEIKKKLGQVDTKLNKIIANYSEKTNIGSLHIQTISKVESTSRIVRVILVFLVFACIIMFTGLWNSLSFSWLQSRIRMHEYQLFWHNNITDNITPNNLSEEETALFSKCSDYYYNKHYSKDILIHELKNLKTANLNHSTFVKVPILSITFDINDMGLIGGLSITIIYFLLVYSLINRYNQLENVFHLIKSIRKKEERESAYFMILMDQILTLPREGLRHYSTIRLIPRVLYIIPVLVLIFVFVNDIITFRNGYHFLDSLGKSIALYTASVLFIVLSSLLATFCIHIVIKTDSLWNTNYPKKQFPND